jgi:hypothetical protein
VFSATESASNPESAIEKFPIVVLLDLPGCSSVCCPKFVALRLAYRTLWNV